ncbi:MAG: hypothetical protein IPI33_09405 [Dehalococcoidia bacterium]|nr:hypothetical protein [Dehalococcoidia bacterium]
MATGGSALAVEGIEHFEFDCQLGIGVVVDGDRGDESLLVVPIQVLDLVLLAAMDVDGIFVDEEGGAGAVALTDDAGMWPLFDDDEVVGAGGAERLTCSAGYASLIQW